MKAVIPAAGLGTRFLPYTKSQPKEMSPVVDKPAIQYVVEEALESGIRDILIITGAASGRLTVTSTRFPSWNTILAIVAGNPYRRDSKAGENCFP